MDRRVVWIIIILIIGLGCMYYAADHSNTVGNAITTFSKTTITMPNGFSVGETTNDGVDLYNKNSNEKINAVDYGKGDHVQEALKNSTDKYNKNPDYYDIKNTTKNINNITVYELDMQTENGTAYCFIFYKYNHTYVIGMRGFDNADKVYKDLEFIVKTLQPDYKQSQD